MGDLRRRWRSRCLAAVTAALVLAGGAPGVQAANHREAPITALDHKADITDVYAFRSYNGGQSLPRVTFILDVDPLLEPGNGPTYFPFDDEILYTIRIDNDRDAGEDIVFEFRFKTEIRNQSGLLRGLWQSYVGVGAGVAAPANSPAPVPPGTPIIPPQVTSFQDVGPRPAPVVHRHHGPAEAPSRPDRAEAGGRPAPLRRPDQRRAEDHGLCGPVRRRDLYRRPIGRRRVRRHQGLGRHGGRSVLDRSRRGLRHPEHQHLPGPEPVPGCRQPELRRRLRLRVQRQRHRDRRADPVPDPNGRRSRRPRARTR